MHTTGRRFLPFAVIPGLLSLTLGAFLFPASPFSRLQAAPAGPETPASRTAKPEREAVEIECLDSSKLKVLLLDETLEVKLAYGKLVIPTKNVTRIEFGLRIPDEVRKRIAAAIAGLGSDDFNRREKAQAELLTLGARAYPTLVKAAKEGDAEVSRRAVEVLEKIEETIPEERLKIPEHDVVHTTEGSKIIGQLVATSLKVQTGQFGTQQLNISDAVTLRTPTTEEVDTGAVAVIPDPGNMTSYQAHIGQTFIFRVTGGGAAPGAVVRGPAGGLVVAGGPLWGTEMYTLDSSLAMAAVHMGVLKPGEVGNVKVTILGPQPAFRGSAQHGVTSADYGAYPGAFRVETSKKRER